MKVKGWVHGSTRFSDSQIVAIRKATKLRIAQALPLNSYAPMGDFRKATETKDSADECRHEKNFLD